jgi:hypothetical protein
MSSSVNVPPDAVPVPMMAMFDGADGSRSNRWRRLATHSVMSAGSEPPVALCEIDPMPGAPAPVALNSFTGSLPVSIRLASALPSASVVYSWSESNVHSPGNSASLEDACTWYGAHTGPSGIG